MANKYKVYFAEQGGGNVKATTLSGISGKNIIDKFFKTHPKTDAVISIRKRPYKRRR